MEAKGRGSGLRKQMEGVTQIHQKEKLKVVKRKHHVGDSDSECIVNCTMKMVDDHQVFAPRIVLLLPAFHFLL
jgi:hypothetical protein